MSRLSRLFEPLIDWDSEMGPLLPELRLPVSLRGRGVGGGSEFPDLNIWDDEQAAYVEAELPGLGADDFQIDIAGAELTISGERKISEPQGTLVRQERATGAFRRTLVLPWDLAADKAEATLRDGVLSVRIPKSERMQVKKIDVKTAG